MAVAVEIKELTADQMDAWLAEHWNPADDTTDSVIVRQVLRDADSYLDSRRQTDAHPIAGARR